MTDTNGKCLIKAEKLRISFSIYKYFFTDEFPVGSVYLENSVITYNPEEDKGTVNSVINLLQSEKESKRSLKNLKIKGNNISLITDTTAGDFKLNNLFMNFSLGDQNIYVDLRTKASGNNIKLQGKKTNFKTDLKLRGESSSDLAWNNYDVEFVNLRTDCFLIRKQNFNINHSKRKIKIIKTKARDPFDLYAEYDIDSRIISLSGKAEKYIPAKYIKYLKNSKQVSGLLKSVYSGSAVFIYRFDSTNSDRLSYSSDISVSFHNSFLPVKNSIKTVFSGNTDYIEIAEFKAETEKGYFEFRGIYDLDKNLPDGEVTLKDLRLSEKFTVNSKTTISIKSENTLFIVSNASAGNLSLNNIECVVTREKDAVNYNLSYISEERGFLTSRGTYSFRNKENYINSETKINNISIRNLSSVLSKNGVGFLPDDVFLNTDFYIETDMKSVNMFTENLSLTDKDGKNSISADFTVSEGNLILYNILIDWNKYSGEGYVDLRNDYDKYSISSYISLNSQSYNLTGDYIPGTSLNITGNNNFNASLFFEKDRTVYFVKTERLPFPVRNSVPEFSFNIRGESGNSGIKFLFNNNSIYNLPFLKGDNNYIKFTSAVSEKEVLIPAFSVKDNFSEVTGNGEFNINSNRNISGWINGISADNNEEHLIMLDYRDGEYEITADFTNFPSERITPSSMSGDLSGTFLYKGTKTNPFYSLDMRMDNGKLLDDPFSFSLSLDASKGSMILNSLRMRYNLNRIDSASGYISRDEGNYSFRGNVFLRKGISDKGKSVDIDLNGDIFDRSFKWFTSPLFVENKGILKVSDQNNLKNEFREWELSYINNESFLIFNGGPGNSIEGEITRKGAFNIELTNPLPVRGFFNGEISNGLINSDFNNIELDMKTFGSLTDIKYFKADSGTATGNLKLSGPVNDPDFNGHLNVSGVKASSVFVPAEITLPNTSFIFNGKSLYMPDTGVSVEENTIKAKLNFSIDHWIPREFNVDITTDPGKMLWIKHEFSMVDIDGFASGRIVIDGDEQGLNISGDLVARKCIITLSGEEKNGKPKKKSSYDYEIDLNITSGPGVEFFWPSVRLPVLRTFAAAGENLSIYSNTASDEYSLNGDIKIQGGEVFYFSQSFFIKQGSIVFNENETKFDPHITARAELRERTSDNREVKISLIAEDTPLSRFSPRFESDPPLNENEIYALLGESVYTQFGGENITFGTALLSAGAYSTQLIGIFRPFEARMKDMLNLDLFTIRTNVLQQAVGSRSKDDIALSDDNTPINSPYLDNTTIFMGKYFGEYFFLESLLSFNTRDFDIYQYNDYDVPEFMGMHIKTELSLEVDTPLFLMDLTLYPRLNDFYNSLEDTSLEFSWRFSY